jgi:hypothetical protein
LAEGQERTPLLSAGWKRKIGMVAEGEKVKTVLFLCTGEVAVCKIAHPQKLTKYAADENLDSRLPSVRKGRWRSGPTET